MVCSIFQFQFEIFLVKVVDRVMDSLDSFFLIVVSHLFPVNSSMLMINVRLNVQNSCNSFFMHGNDVGFNLRIGTDEKVCLIDFIEREASDKVSISFIDLTIYYENFIHIRPLRWPIYPQNAIICRWILNLKKTWRLSLPNSILLHIILDWVFVSYLRQGFVILKLILSNIELPWFHLLSCEPNDFLALFHFHRTFALLIPRS